MDGSVEKFGTIARGSARSPLGIIALFIVLVYGFAALTLSFSGSLRDSEHLFLVLFLVVFPVLVLGVFTWLVIGHSHKLFGPSDFRDEANYMKMVSAAVSLTAAHAKSPEGLESGSLSRVVRSIQRAGLPTIADHDGWRRRVLWVDDRPENNVFERNAFEAFGIEFKLSLNTVDALHQVNAERFAAVISDMGRKEGPREGYALLDRMRELGDSTPVFFYAGSNSPAHKKETEKHGGQGCTNDANELFEMVTRTVIRAS